MGKGSDCGGAVTRVRATRVNAEDLIDKMLAETVIANIDDQDEHNCSRGTHPSLFDHLFLWLTDQ